jgi:predicted metal-dependent hydrolase
MSARLTGFAAFFTACAIFNTPAGKRCGRLLQHLQYDIRESARALNVTLKVNRTDGLVVVVPRHFDQELVPGIVSSRQEWITRQLARFERRPGRFEVDWPPKRLELRGIERSLKVDYLERACSRIKIIQSGDELQLILPENTADNQLVDALTRWLKNTGREHLVSRAFTLANRYGFEFAKVVIRGQKTRWGSYSSHGTLSLNYKLLFLPSHLVTYVILHELVHTLYMDHSASFWRLLEQVDPMARQNDRDLRDGWRYLPAWLD